MPLPSNDAIVDRRIAWAQRYAESGDHAAAADLLSQTMELAPGWAPGWAALAEARERCGDLAGARDAWTRAREHDGTGGLGAEAHLARLDGRTPASLPSAYLRALFDDYAPRFDRHLTEALEYRGPAVILAALDRAAPGRRFERALDLGCGTGLMGAALRGRADRLGGVDLSPAMVERARATGFYAELSVGALEDGLAAAPAGGLDLVVAADVFVYLGDLAPALALAARALRPGGLLAFTVQALAGGGGHALGPDMRFSHAPSHVLAALAAAGLDVLLLEPASTRRERDAPVPGLVAVAEVAGGVAELSERPDRPGGAAAPGGPQWRAGPEPAAREEG